MQIQSINSTPAFQANHLRTAVKISNLVNQSNTTIDIYSINKSDSDLINRVLTKINVKNRIDKYAIKEKNNVNNAILNILTKALNLKEESSDGVYMAVKNKKYIAGFLDYTNGGMPLLKNLVVWRNGNNDAARMNLFAQFLKDSIKGGKTDIVAYSEPKTKGGMWLLEKGFKIPPQEKSIRQRFVMPRNSLNNYIMSTENFIEVNSGMKIVQKSEKNIKLTNLDL